MGSSIGAVQDFVEILSITASFSWRKLQLRSISTAKARNVWRNLAEFVSLTVGNHGQKAETQTYLLWGLFIALLKLSLFIYDNAWFCLPDLELLELAWWCTVWETECLSKAINLPPKPGCLHLNSATTDPKCIQTFHHERHRLGHATALVRKRNRHVHTSARIAMAPRQE